MLRRLSLVHLAGLLLLAATFISTAQASELRTAKQPIEGQYIVVLKDDVTNFGSNDARGITVASAAQSMARAHGAQLKASFSHVLPAFVIRANPKSVARLLEDERVAYVEEDAIVSINATQNNATWGLDRIDQRDRPLNGSYTYNTTASNVHTYIIDTGVLGSHNEFSGRMGNGYTAINDGRGWTDCNGHGTHVAGTVAGSTYGVAKGATVHAVRVLGCNGSGSNSGVIAGMDWVAANAQSPAVANMSLGGGASTATDNAVANMRNSGVTVVVAAGNENQNACNVSPARSAAAITVGSTTSSDSRSSFSNYGSCVDIFAPGSSITSAWSTGSSATNTISGTSMASPHVAGVAALYLADNSGASPAQVENAIFSAGSTGKLSNIRSGSPNLLAYSLFGGSGGDDGGDGTAELSNGVPESNLSGGQGSQTFFTIDVPSGATNLEIAISGGSGDADLYVRFGAEPTTSTYDCRPYRNGNNESCDFTSPQIPAPTTSCCVATPATPALAWSPALTSPAVAHHAAAVTSTAARSRTADQRSSPTALTTAPARERIKVGWSVRPAPTSIWNCTAGMAVAGAKSPARKAPAAKSRSATTVRPVTTTGACAPTRAAAATICGWIRRRLKGPSDPKRKRPGLPGRFLCIKSFARPRR